MFDSLETATFIMATTDNMDEWVFNSGVGLLSPDKEINFVIIRLKY